MCEVAAKLTNRGVGKNFIFNFDPIEFKAFGYSDPSPADPSLDAIDDDL